MASRHQHIFASVISYHFSKILIVHDLNKRDPAGTMAKKSEDPRNILPGLPIMEDCDKTKPVADKVKYDGGETITEKLCPFDKKPCIRASCAVYREDSDVCAFLLTGRLGAGNTPTSRRNTDDRGGGKFKAHLFD